MKPRCSRLKTARYVLRMGITLAPYAKVASRRPMGQVICHSHSERMKRATWNSTAFTKIASLSGRSFRLRVERSEIAERILARVNSRPNEFGKVSNLCKETQKVQRDTQGNKEQAGKVSRFYQEEEEVRGPEINHV